MWCTNYFALFFLVIMDAKNIYISSGHLYVVFFLHKCLFISSPTFRGINYHFFLEFHQCFIDLRLAVGKYFLPFCRVFCFVFFILINILFAVQRLIPFLQSICLFLLVLVWPMSMNHWRCFYISVMGVSAYVFCNIVMDLGMK